LHSFYVKTISTDPTVLGEDAISLTSLAIAPKDPIRTLSIEHVSGVLAAGNLSSSAFLKLTTHNFADLSFINSNVYDITSGSYLHFKDYTYFRDSFGDKQNQLEYILRSPTVVNFETTEIIIEVRLKDNESCYNTGGDINISFNPPADSNIRAASCVVRINAPGVSPEIKLLSSGFIDVSTHGEDAENKNFFNITPSYYANANYSNFSGINIYKKDDQSKTIIASSNPNNISSSVLNSYEVVTNDEPETKIKTGLFKIEKVFNDDTHTSFHYKVSDSLHYNPEGYYTVEAISTNCLTSSCEFKIGNAMENTISYDLYSTIEPYKLLSHQVQYINEQDLFSLDLDKELNDISKNTAYTIDNLKVNAPSANAIYFKTNSSLNAVKKIDFSLCTNLQYLTIFNSKISELDLSNNNKLLSVDIEDIPNLKELKGLEKALNLRYLSIDRCGSFTHSLDLSKNMDLEEVLIKDTEFTTETNQEGQNVAHSLIFPSNLRTLIVTGPNTSRIKINMNLSRTDKLQNLYLSNIEFTEPTGFIIPDTVSSLQICNTNIRQVNLSTNTGLVTKALNDQSNPNKIINLFLLFNDHLTKI
jgi:hypothetical protein